MLLFSQTQLHVLDAARDARPLTAQPLAFLPAPLAFLDHVQPTVSTQPARLPVGLRELM